MKMTRKICAALLALVLVCGMFAGCGANTTWVYESDGIEVPAGMYINFMMYALADMQVAEVEANATNPDFTMPATKTYLKAYGADGVRNADKVRENAKVLAGEFFIVNRMFDERGLVLNAEDLAATQNYTDSIWDSNSDIFEKNGIGRESIRQYQIYLMKKDILFADLYGAEGERAVAQEELLAQFTTSYAKVEVMTVAVSSDTAAEDEARAQDYLARYKAGEAITELDYENRLAITTGDAAASVTKNEADAHINIISLKDAAGDALLSAIAALPNGEVTMVLDSSIYFIVKKLDLSTDAEALETYQEDVLHDLKFADFEGELRMVAQDTPMNVNEAAYNRYKPERLKFE